MITAYSDIKKIIEEAQDPQDQVNQLDFSSIKIFKFTQKIKSMVQKCQKLSILKLCQCQLISLDKLPKLDITVLDLSTNKLKDSDLQELTKYVNLSILNLNDNFISSLNSLKILKRCTQLKDLQLSGNQIQKHKNFREQAFQEIKCLVYLDKKDKQGKDIEYGTYSDDVISEEQEQESDYQSEQNEQDEEQLSKNEQSQSNQNQNQKFQVQKKRFKEN